MRTVEKEVKAKGAVVGTATINIPENWDEAASLGADGLSALEYGLTVKAMNAIRSEVTGGPKSLKSAIYAKLQGLKMENPEAFAKICKQLGVEEEPAS